MFFVSPSLKVRRSSDEKPDLSKNLKAAVPPTPPYRTWRQEEIYGLPHFTGPPAASVLYEIESSASAPPSYCHLIRQDLTDFQVSVINPWKNPLKILKSFAVLYCFVEKICYNRIVLRGVGSAFLEKCPAEHRISGRR